MATSDTATVPLLVAVRYSSPAHRSPLSARSYIIVSAIDPRLPRAHFGLHPLSYGVPFTHQFFLIIFFQSLLISDPRTK